MVAQDSLKGERRDSARTLSHISAGGSPRNEGSQLDDETMDQKQKEENDQILREASAQAVRRAQRKRRMREEDEREAGTFGDAAAFKIGYKRTQGNGARGSSADPSDVAAEDLVAANQMRSRWGTMKGKNADELLKLDVDLLEDLVEATGNIIHDRCALNRFHNYDCASLILLLSGRAAPIALQPVSC